ncbi:hypothetical protein NDU88_002885 [Pleurodeles waltl]|uniref:Uncharacterized protein n=1 Tax=Pleurodeles waltl TaxID=8319 RepID=A0AAV7M9H0_PLEWA|nr:hypothetical protein NDU88_002885 [Pleurodeles waltl]
MSRPTSAPVSLMIAIAPLGETAHGPAKTICAYGLGHYLGGILKRLRRHKPMDHYLMRWLVYSLLRPVLFTLVAKVMHEISQEL